VRRRGDKERRKCVCGGVGGGVREPKGAGQSIRYSTLTKVHREVVVVVVVLMPEDEEQRNKNKNKKTPRRERAINKGG
jgi:hypothetical protein